MTNEEAIGWLESLERLDKEQDVALEMAIEALQERKTGKWIEKNGMYICTACEHRLSKLAVYDVGGIYNYCPNCGSKMEVDE